MKANMHIVFGLLSVLVGGIVGFLIVRTLFGSVRRKERAAQVASFDFYVDTPIVFGPGSQSAVQ